MGDEKKEKERKRGGGKKEKKTFDFTNTNDVSPHFITVNFPFHSLEIKRRKEKKERKKKRRRVVSRENKIERYRKKIKKKMKKKHDSLKLFEKPTYTKALCPREDHHNQK